ncbi:MAG: aspartate kinase [Clostridia bacterium]|nr:aspartate kinase [Clostridia bacterium]
MRILVQKFGGTSVATAEKRRQAVARIREAREKGYHPVVVVSAMGRQGDPYATDTLLARACEERAEIDRREKALLLNCGEIISAVFMVQSLAAAGLPAMAFTGGQSGIRTEPEYENARILTINPERIIKCLEEEKIAVVAGFQGVDRDGEFTTLGRGGSDITAAALGVALQAEAVEIFTDVDGVMTADPRVVSQARPVRVMTYNELSEMAHQGAKVIHPRAVEIAGAGRIPLRIKSTFSGGEGTLITGPADPQVSATSGAIAISGDKIVTGLAHTGGMARIELVSGEDLNESHLVLEVFRLLAEAGISLDMIQVSPKTISFIIKEPHYRQALSLLAQTGLKINAATGFAKVAVTGAGMQGVPGVMARVVQGLKKARAPVFQTTDSHASIACLVKEEDLQRVLLAFHEEFGLSAMADGQKNGDY